MNQIQSLHISMNSCTTGITILTHVNKLYSWNSHSEAVKLHMMFYTFFRKVTKVRDAWQLTSLGKSGWLGTAGLCVVLDSLASFSTVLKDCFSAGGIHRGLIPRQQSVAYDCPPPPTPPPCLGISAFIKGFSLISAIFHLLLSLRWCEVVHYETYFPSSCQIQRSP